MEFDFKSIVEKIDDVILIISKIGKIVYVSPSIKRFGGYEAKIELNKNIKKYFMKDIKKYKQFNSKIVRNKSFSLNFSFLRKSKKTIYAKISVKSYNKKSSEKYYQCNIQNIDEQSKNELENLKENRILRELWNRAPVAYHRINKEGIIVDVNQTELDMLGYKRNHMINKSIFDFVLPEQRKSAYRRFKQKLSGKKVLHAHDRVYQKKNGNKFYVNIEDVLEYNEKGQIIGIRTSMADITYRKQIEDKLKESEEKLKTIFNNSAVAITVTDKNERIVQWNPYVEMLFGYKKEDIINMHVSKLYSRKEWLRIRKLDIRKQGHMHHFETQIINSKKKPIDVDISISVFRGKHAEIIGSIGIIRDITKRKKAQKEREKLIKKLQDKSTELITTNKDLVISEEDSEYKRKKLEIQSKELKKANVDLIGAEKKLSRFNEQLELKVKERTSELEYERNKIEQLLQQKTEFINQLSHDIRTPLTPIITIVSVLKYKLKEKDIQKRLDIISKNADYLKSLVINTLNLAKIDLGKVDFNFINARIHTIIQESILLNTVILKDKKIKVINLVNNKHKVICDRLRIKEVFQNLLMNSIKFMPKGGKITFKIKQKKNSVILSMTDTGIGMRKEICNRIFDEFYKADESRHLHSSGLGLAISKRIITKHQGKIWATSQGLGMGSTFHIELPSYQNISNAPKE
jgi:PAS domain S-box-containing protein